MFGLCDKSGNTINVFAIKVWIGMSKSAATQSFDKIECDIGSLGLGMLKFDSKNLSAIYHKNK